MNEARSIWSMRDATVRSMGIALFIVGLGATAWSVYSGLTRFYLVVIVPVFASDSLLGMLPLLAIFAGIVLMALAPAFYADDEDMERTDDFGMDRFQNGAKRPMVGGVVLIGPIPILFGTDRKITLIAAGLVILILAITVLLLLR
jgi:uncharacterized protein (TIGR00304 family)